MIAFAVSQAPACRAPARPPCEICKRPRGRWAGVDDGLCRFCRAHKPLLRRRVLYELIVAHGSERYVDVPGLGTAEVARVREAIAAEAKALAGAKIEVGEDACAEVHRAAAGLRRLRTS